MARTDSPDGCDLASFQHTNKCCCTSTLISIEVWSFLDILKLTSKEKTFIIMWRKLQSNLHLRPPHENGHLSRRIVHTLTLIKTSLQWQWPLECIPNCQNNLSATANFFQQLMKKSRMVMLCFLNKIVILHPYLPMTTTSPPWPLSSIPKVDVVERFNCMQFFYKVV